MTTTNSTQIFKRTFEEMKMHGMKLPSDRVFFCIPDARNVLWRAICYFISQETKQPVWLPEYEKVAAWLADNEGKGLFMFGNCGRGKSVLCRFVIPLLLLQYCRKIVSVYDIQDMNRDIDGVLTKHIIALDDVGTEEVSVKYGERRVAFAEVMDAAEKHGKLLIVSTNLGEKELRERYGDRVIDRIRSTTLRVPFNGESLRK